MFSYRLLIKLQFWNIVSLLFRNYLTLPVPMKQKRYFPGNNMKSDPLLRTAFHIILDLY